MLRSLGARRLLPVFALLLGAPAFPQTPPLDEAARGWVEHTLETMTVEERVGQLIIAAAGTDFTNVTTPVYQEIERNITRFHVGGYHAMGGGVYSAAFLIRRMQRLARIPLLIASNLEGGVGLILSGATRFPKAMALGATFNPEYCRTVGAITAVEAKSVGINLNFYPVADVNNNPGNPIISIRSFGEDPVEVSRMVRAYIEGFQGEGLLATAKHFPGHGDTTVDSHMDLPVIESSREHLDEIELPPFRAAIEAGVGTVMTAHLRVPALEPDPRLPASLSPGVVSTLLRETLSFAGLVVTDAMNMGGLRQLYRSEAEAAVQAVQAGADLILYPSSVEEVHAGLTAAVKRGEISGTRLETSVRRILEAKAGLQLHLARSPDVNLIDTVVASVDHLEAAQRIMDEAVTLVRDERGALPFSLRKAQRVLLLTVLDEDRPIEPRGLSLIREFRRYHSRFEQFRVLPKLSDSEADLLTEKARQADYLIVATYVRVADSKGSVELAPAQLRLLKRLSAVETPSAFVHFGSPYLLSAVPELPSYILTYDDHTEAEVAAVKAVLGGIPFRGRLPVALPGAYPVGYSLRK